MRVGVKFGVHKGYFETFSDSPYEAMNGMLMELITEDTEGDT